MSTWYETIRQDFVFPSIDPSAPLHEALKTALGAFEQHILTSPHVRAHLAKLPKGPGTDCPDAPLDDLIRYVTTQRATIDKSDPSLTIDFLASYVDPVLGFEQEIVEDVMLDSDEIDETQYRVFLRCEDLGKQITDLWKRWFREIVIPYQSLSPYGRQYYDVWAKQVLMQWDYTVSRYDPVRGVHNRQTWAEAFPFEISLIANTLEELEACDLAGLSEYFKALREAYTCTDIGALEEKWCAVDEAWIRIPSTALFVPVHGMESGYEHPFGVSPEFRLELRTPLHRDIIEARRTATLDHASALGLSNEMIAQAADKLARTDTAVFMSIVRGGVCLNFRYMGQAVPNREEVLVEGGRIFIDETGQANAVERYQRMINMHCAPVTAETLAPLITPETQTAATSDHEFAHKVGRTEETDKALGGNNLKLCEEAKATLLGYLAEEHLDSRPERRLAIVANMTGRVLRFMQKAALSDVTIEPYIRENLAAATMLFETGVISVETDGVHVDLDRARTNAWFDALRVFNRGVLDAYRATEAPALQALAARYCDKKHPQIARLIEWVNRSQ